jgi:hypothetical protein
MERTADAGPSLSNWWGTAIVGYGKGNSNFFRCASLKKRRFDNGIRWQWKFDCHNVGYGMNAYFLGIHPYAGDDLVINGLSFQTRPWFKRTRIVNPAQNVVIGDGMPKSDGMWSSSLWWPTSCMDPKTSTTRAYEGIDPNRHLGTGVVVFNDGHSEARKSAQIRTVCSRLANLCANLKTRCALELGTNATNCPRPVGKTANPLDRVCPSRNCSHTTVLLICDERVSNPKLPARDLNRAKLKPLSALTGWQRHLPREKSAQIAKLANARTKRLAAPVLFAGHANASGSLRCNRQNHRSAFRARDALHTDEG